MNDKNLLRKSIKEFVDELVGKLRTELGDNLASITLTGSYVTVDFSLQRPNVNLLIFINKDNSFDLLKIGKIINQICYSFTKHFSIKLDAFPFKSGRYSSRNKRKIIFSPRVLFIENMNSHPPFGIPSNILQGMKSMRQVIYGSDPLNLLDLNYTREDLLRWALSDVVVLFRSMLALSPLFYIKDRCNLVDDSITFGKSALTWGVEIFSDMDSLKDKRHIKLIRKKEKLVDFYANINRNLCEAAKIILDARVRYEEYVKNEKKAVKLYQASRFAVLKVSSEVLNEISKN